MNPHHVFLAWWFPCCVWFWIVPRPVGLAVLLPVWLVSAITCAQQEKESANR